MMETVYFLGKFTTIAVNSSLADDSDVFSVVGQNKAKCGTVPAFWGFQGIVVIRVSAS